LPELGPESYEHINRWADISESTTLGRMISRRAALTTFGLGVIAFVAGTYGVVGPDLSVLLAGLGFLTLLCGAGFLITVAHPLRLSTPHPGVLLIALLAFALHAYEHLNLSAGNPSFGFLVWSMAPYCVAFAVSLFPATRRPVVPGAALALAFDLWGHYSVFVNPQGSTAALALLFIPLWSTIIIIPLATFLVWAIVHRRGGHAGHAP
jgi:hypothetical protein